MPTTDSVSSIDRNLRVASRFLDGLEQLPPERRRELSASEFGGTSHTNAMMAIADDITTLRNGDREGRVGQFLVDAERRIGQLGLDAEVAGLVKGAVRALLVNHLPGREQTTRELYTPFERLMPLEALRAD